LKPEVQALLGDYEVSPQITNAQAREVLKWASEFLAAAEGALSGS